MPAYDPWEHFSELAYRDRTLGLVMIPLPAGLMGLYEISVGMARRPNTIVLDSRLTVAEARCTLAHEIVHYERQDDPRAWRQAGLHEDLIETLVQNIAACRLISLRSLRAAMRATEDEQEQARRLRVDLLTLQGRKQGAAC